MTETLPRQPVLWAAQAMNHRAWLGTNAQRPARDAVRRTSDTRLCLGGFGRTHTRELAELAGGHQGFWGL